MLHFVVGMRKLLKQVRIFPFYGGYEHVTCRHAEFKTGSPLYRDCVNTVQIPRRVVLVLNVLVYATLV